MADNKKNNSTLEKDIKELTTSTKPFIDAMINASKLLSEHKEDVDKLNVFPVPDGDTGTNMSLTLESVVDYVKGLGENPSFEEIRRAVTTGALMGARGNSGVITSQILRGICEGFGQQEQFNTEGLSAAFSRAQEVAFAAVRKPVEGTILTVLRDSAKAARFANRKKMNIIDAMTHISEKAHQSVENTPNLLPVLKENNVVDAGGYGLAILIEGFSSSLTGKSGTLTEELQKSTDGSPKPKVEIEQINDWAGSKYRYCNEFLVDSVKLKTDDALKFLSSIGDCELCVGAAPKFKVHVHSDHPDQVLAYFLGKGQVSEVFIHNMQMQSENRVDKLSKEDEEELNKKSRKKYGIVAVAVGAGNEKILKSLGVDVIVSGGQTMNPSTKDLADAAIKAHAENIIFLPNNKNIIMAAKSACDVLEEKACVIETKDLPSAFSAMMVFDNDASIEDNQEAMQESFEDLTTAEITFAIKDSKDANNNPIKNGDCIGIVNGEIIAVSKNIHDTAMLLLEKLEADDKDMLTILCGSDFDEKECESLTEEINDKYEDLEIDDQRGEQPLYPLILSLE